MTAFTSGCTSECEADSEELFVCGDVTYEFHDGVQAAVAAIQNDGTVSRYFTISGTNSQTVLGNNQDKCRGLSLNAETTELAVLVQARAGEQGRSSVGNYFDSVLVLLALDEGGLSRSVSFTYGEFEQSMYLAFNGLIQVPDSSAGSLDYFFAG